MAQNEKTIKVTHLGVAELVWSTDKVVMVCSRRLGREDCEFKANPGYITRCLFKKYTFLVYVQFTDIDIYIIHIHTIWRMEL